MKEEYLSRLGLNLTQRIESLSFGKPCLSTIFQNLTQRIERKYVEKGYNYLFSGISHRELKELAKPLPTTYA